MHLIRLVDGYSSPFLVSAGEVVRHNRRNKPRVTAVVKYQHYPCLIYINEKYVPRSIHATKDKPKALWAAVQLEFPTIVNRCGPRVRIEVNFDVVLVFHKGLLEKMRDRL